MNYTVTEHHTVVWLWFILYAITIVLLIPNSKKEKANSITTAEDLEAANKQALQFASKLVLRTVLIVPMLFLLQRTL